MADSKVWGITEPLMLSPGMHMHRITFEAGGVCSEHYHQSRYNLFYVISGELLVRIWDGDRITEQVLRAHEFLSVEPLVRHQFEGVKSGVALEIYWPGTPGYVVDENDITRFTQGFMR